MSEPRQFSDKDELSRLLDRLPGDVPDALRDLIAQAANDAESGSANETGTALPPSVFVETVEQLPLAISITDRKAIIIYVNAAFCGVSGYAPEELVGFNQSMNSASETPADIYQGLWASITSGQVWNGQLVNKRKDGSRYVVDLTIVPVKGPDGDVQFYVGMHRDISEVHKLEKENLNQRTLIESVIQAAPVAMAVLDRADNVVVVNHAYEQMAADFRGDPPAPRILDAVADALGTSTEAIFQDQTKFAHIEVRVDPGGNREPKWVSCSGTWVDEHDSRADGFFSGSSRSGLLMVCNDITLQRKRYEQARTALVKALMADQQRIDSIRETIAAAIFQLQVPMNMVGAALNVIERQGQGEGALAGALREVVSTADEALDRLRMAMPSQSLEGIEPINLNEVVRDVLDVEFDRFLKAGAVVNWQPTSVLAKVPGRSSALRTAIKHMLDNAVDAISESSSPDREILVRTRATSGGMIEVSISDSGPGISDDDKLKLFEPFYCGWKRRRGHSGMGLSMAQQIISDQGGGIVIENRAEGGAVVKATFATRPPGEDY
ncbi:MAG: nitrogen fixation negative regulator NifL [Magnetovibrionaceae bacterium]